MIALSGAPAGAAPSGTLFNCWKITGITVTGVSMMIVPVTVGVRMRRNKASRAEKASWNNARARTSEARRAGPPASSAAMLTAIETPAEPVAMR